MDYPTGVPFVLQSQDRRMDPVLLSIARNGAPKTRRLYERPRREFRIVHRGLTDEQKQIVEDFLTLNRMTTFTIHWPCRIGGTAYAVLEKDGEFDWAKDDGKWSTTINVIEA